ncbi:MAG: hypothetical protein M3O80_03950 [Chloroflexota bacterium]|nr:hypothetical protein [Chloroflexota bacterium]
MTRSPAYCLPVDGNGERTVARLTSNGLSKHNVRGSPGRESAAGSRGPMNKCEGVPWRYCVTPGWLGR